MNFDFSALLVFLTFISGLIWLLDHLFFAAKRKSDSNDGIDDSKAKQVEYSNEPILVEYSRSFFPIFLIVLILRSFIFEPFKIPSGSMMPTLLIGDFILVNKYDYGLRLPVLHNKFIDKNTPKRGDIVVFRYPEDPSIPFIKRVVALSGDKITYYNKTLFINDVEAEQVLNGRYNATGAGYKNNDGLSLRIEHLDELDHQILVDPSQPWTKDVEIMVPEGHYFVLGDNRDNSKDSRYWGFVPDENLVGRAFMIWMNFDWETKSKVDFSRIGTILK